MTSTTNSLESQFKEQMSSLISGGGKKIILTKDEYYSLIEEVNIAGTASKKTDRQYYLLKRYVKYFVLNSVRTTESIVILNNFGSTL